MKRFKYDVVKLIQAVRDRPCLWNRNAENYKDRMDRKQAWTEIFNILDERYEEMSSTDKRMTSEMVLTKWTNVRDTFVKTLRKKGLKGKHYVLHDDLAFLLPFLEINQDQDNLGYDDQPTTEEIQRETYIYLRKSPEYDSEAASEGEITNYKASCSKRKRMKKESHHEETEEVGEDNIDFAAVDDPRIMNEDEAFFASLLPTVVRYNEDERLEFRIEVLALMKRINNKRK